MKKIKKMLYCLAAVLLFTACNRDPVTYKFDKADADKLLPHYTVGKILTFRNELGEERQFNITKSEQKVRQDWIFVGMGGTNMYYFFFESKGIFLINTVTQGRTEIYFHQSPIDQEKARHNIHHKYKSQLLVEIDGASLDFEKKKSSRNINGIEYKNVIEIRCADFSYGYFLYNAKNIYYDIYHGIIEFYEDNGHQWKLVNE